MHLVPEVGAHHGGVGADRVGGAAGDDLPEVQHHDPVADRHDEVHVVLDEQHGHALGEAADPGAERVHLALGQPAGGLVEQQEPRLGHEGTGQRRALLNGVGQGGGEPAGVVGGAELVEDLHGAGRHPPFLPARPPQPRKDDTRSLCSPGSAPSMTFSCTVRPAHSPMPCSVREIPSLARSWGRCVRRTLPP